MSIKKNVVEVSVEKDLSGYCVLIKFGRKRVAPITNLTEDEAEKIKYAIKDSFLVGWECCLLDVSKASCQFDVK